MVLIETLANWHLIHFSSAQFSSVAQSCLTLLQPHELQHARHSCPSPISRVYLNSCPSSRWCHPAISSSVSPFSSCLQSLPASGSFPMSQLFVWGGQSIGSFSFIISPSNEYLGLIHLKALKPRTILWQGNIMLFVSSRFVRKFHPLFWTTDKTSPHDTKLPGMLSNHAFQNLCSFLLFGYHCNTSYPTEKELLVALEYK